MDIALVLPDTNTLVSIVPYADIQIQAPGLLIDQDLLTAIIISLFANRQAAPDDNIDGVDRQGWWGDSYATINGDKIGSRLWELARSKQTQDTLNRAQQYCVEALQWLIDDGVAQSVQVQTANNGNNILAIAVTINKPSGTAKFNFQYVWEQI